MRFSQLKKEFFFGSVFRVVFEVYLDITFGSIYNLYDAKYESYVDYYSHIVSISLLFIFLLITFCIPLIFLCSPDKHKIYEGRFKILQEDFQKGRKSLVLDHFLSLIRRLILSCLLIFRWNHGIQQVIFFLLICIWIIAWKVVARPFESTILNFQDLLFEILLLIILILYFAFTSSTSELQSRGFFHVCGVICVVLILSMIIINFLISIILYCKRCRSKKTEKVKKGKIKVKPRKKSEKIHVKKLAKSDLEQSKIGNISRVSSAKMVRTQNSRSFRSSIGSKMRKTTNTNLKNGPNTLYPHSARKSGRNSSNRKSDLSGFTLN